jgi:ABC-type antimicrobial peptide transport system permease subunit
LGAGSRCRPRRCREPPRLDSSGTRSSAWSATSSSSAWRWKPWRRCTCNTLRSTVYAVDPNQPVENVQTLDDLRSEALAAPRLTAILLGVFAALALLVTLAGIGGVIATSVQQRTKEFGLRMALGARRDSVLTMVVRQGLTLVLIGLALGVVGALVAGRVLSAYLYQTAPRDPLIFASVAALFILSGVVACLIPARRATTVDPLIALRAE